MHKDPSHAKHIDLLQPKRARRISIFQFLTSNSEEKIHQRHSPRRSQAARRSSCAPSEMHDRTEAAASSGWISCVLPSGTTSTQWRCALASTLVLKPHQVWGWRFCTTCFDVSQSLAPEQGTYLVRRYPRDLASFPVRHLEINDADEAMSFYLTCPFNVLGANKIFSLIFSMTKHKVLLQHLWYTRWKTCTSSFLSGQNSRTHSNKVKLTRIVHIPRDTKHG